MRNGGGGAFAEDCNSNGIEDAIEIATSEDNIDCNSNSIPDICELGGAGQDCNGNYDLDECDIAEGVSEDLDTNGVPDECELTNTSTTQDCNDNGILDECDLDCGAWGCNVNGCGQETDCNYNFVPDSCDIDDGTSEDCNGNDIPDECEAVGRKLEIIFLFDTSGSMSELSTTAMGCYESIAHMQLQGMDIKYKSLAVGLPGCFNVGCLGTVDELLGDVIEYQNHFCVDTVPSGGYKIDPEAWATAVAIVAQHWVELEEEWEWTGEYDRIVIPVSDEAACKGGICMVDDWEAIGVLPSQPDNIISNSAIDYCQRNNVHAFPVISGQQPDDCEVTECANPLAVHTGGNVIMNYNGELIQNFTLALMKYVDSNVDCNFNNQWDFCDTATGQSLDCNDNDIPDECEGDCNENGVPDDCDIFSGEYFDCNDNDIPDDCEQDCNQNGLHDSCDIADGTSVDVNNNLIPDECDIRYVTRNADGENNGTTWDNAYTDLQFALAEAAADPYIREIRMGMGEFCPSTTDESISYTLENCVDPDRTLRIIGGYLGGEGTEGLWDPSIFPTIITGERGDPQDDTDNTQRLFVLQDGCHVIFDSLTIRNGYADAWPGTRGGGVYSIRTDLGFVNCQLLNNYAVGGGAIYIKEGSLEISRSVLDANTSISSGGAILFEGIDSDYPALFIDSSTLTSNQALFTGTSSTVGGGCVNAYFADVSIHNSFFGNNLAGSTIVDGGALYIRYSDVSISQTTFTENDSKNRGGAIYMLGHDSVPCSLNIERCLFDSNTADSSSSSVSPRGGAIFAEGTGSQITNSQFSGNEANYGGAISYLGNADQVQNSTLTITNCTLQNNLATAMGGSIEVSNNDASQARARIYNTLLWDNMAFMSGQQAAHWVGDYSTIEMYNSNIQGGRSDLESTFTLIEPASTDWTTTGLNMALAPTFVDANGADNLAGTLDDDLRLSTGSAGIDEGLDTYIAGYDRDLMGRPRIQNTVDIGAYELHDCSAWYPGSADWMDYVDAADPGTNIDLKDFYYMQQCVGSMGTSCADSFDINQNGQIDPAELALLMVQMDSSCNTAPSAPAQMSGMAMMAMPGAGVPEGESALQEQADPWVEQVEELSIAILPMTGEMPVTQLHPHTQYRLQYTTDFGVTDYTVLVHAASAEQGIVSASASSDGPWSADTGFDVVDYETLLGTLSAPDGDGFVQTDLIANTIALPGASSGVLCTFKTGDPGTVRFQVDCITILNGTFEMVYASQGLAVPVVSE